MADSNRKPNTPAGKNQKKPQTGTDRTGTAKKKTAAGTSSGSKNGTAKKKTAGRSAEERRAAAQAKREREIKEQREKLAKIIIIAAIIVIVIILAVAIPKGRKDETASEESSVSAEIEEITVVEVPFSEVRHFSFGPLSVDESGRTLTIAQFLDILKELYADGYVLIDPDCITVAYGASAVKVPEGKKPLIISQRDVSYPFSRQGDSYAQKLVMDTQGNVTCQFEDRTGNVSYGEYDFIPIVESFIRSHPDFSYNNARGLIGLTGYNGILGYRTTTYLGSTENNPYAEMNGTFDPSTETSKASSVVRALKMKNWRFACCGFASDITYSSEAAVVQADAELWSAEVGSIVGECPFLIYPNQSDIDSWAVYDDSNPKYTALKDLGFAAFFAKSDTPGIFQRTDTYIREGIYEINSYSDYTAARARG